jgi:hypothetical protein
MYILLFEGKNALPYYNAGIVVVNSEVVEFAPGLVTGQDLWRLKFKV